ncbi:site-2 protease family protein [Roseimaritima ulvae]|uniref:Zinc metalloprotease n=1 Tax=Roseimaritima ulvae TaxID=980254 RepID=A0A5B9R039_9BACT|nr:site-2 protease family protein [Roseimaritima ulvae]QEG43085.1 Putative zinc metalloprotease Rip3 [Roseimaritima ulvae]
MLGSWNLGKFAGIEVRIHWTFLLLPMWIYFSSLVAGSGAAAASVAVLLILAIFGCVVLHEYGHALTARLFGIPTKDITLLPIGGVARLERMPRSPLQELAIAVAGPAVNVVIAFALFVGLALPAVGALLPAAVVGFLSKLAWVNVALVVFNMLPAFPMDGGRVLRASLALFMPYATATRAAARVGQIAAIGFAILGLFNGNPMLVLLAAFVFLAAKGEAMMVAREQGAEAATGSDAYRPQSDPRAAYQPPAPMRSLPVVSAAWNARNVLGWLSSDSIDEFLVSSRGVVIAIVRKSDLADVVRSGMGTLSMERLLSNRSLPFHDVRRGAPA